ncbi:MAG TPA: hypothetical protein VHX44_03695, partial [Planctomycetota bacterium]|nr:hypothetical protein [Planctomycetota bacterium]
MFARLLLVLLFLPALLVGEDTPAAAPVSPWPLDIPHNDGVITLYQPQLEKLEGNTLTGRAAASFLANGKPEDDRVFGALWFTAKLDIDRVNDVAKARSIEITRVVTPKGEKAADDGAAAKKAIQDAVIAKSIEMDLDRLVATLEDAGDGKQPEFNPKPPRVLIRTVPTVLVVLDGDAIIKDVDGMKRVVNSPAFIAGDADGKWWLRGKLDWLVADDLKGPWKVPTTSPMPSITEAAKKAGFPTAVARTAESKAPEVILATEPTELLLFDGKPSFEPIGEGALLGADNTDDDVVVEVASGTQWILLSGRWYKGDKLAEDTTWTFVPADELPAAFGTIPATGDWSSLRVHVANTPEANEAVAQQQVPQTARVPRTNTISITFDGDPKWEKVKDLPVEYAKNTGDSVFRLPGPQYFACRDGVWYQAPEPTGPYKVATSVPDVLHKLPPDNPHHNVTYVYVYESDPAYVWCGYTPGYMGWYCWYGCPVWGTGWPYHGWYHHHVYPMPHCTWGMRVHYNSYSGWGVSVGIAGPHWSIAIGGGGYGGWYGPGGGNNINIDNDINIGNDIGGGNRPGNRPGDRPGNGAGNRPANRPALYDRVPGADRPNLEEAGNRLRQPSAGQQPAGSRENLAVDRDGNIARPTQNGGWQTRENGGWKDQPRAAQTPGGKPTNRPSDLPSGTKPGDRPEAKPATRNVERPPADRSSSYERTQQQRNRGEQRVQQRSSAPARSYGGGGGRAGGGGGGGRARNR